MSWLDAWRRQTNLPSKSLSISIVTSELRLAGSGTQWTRPAATTATVAAIRKVKDPMTVRT